MRTYWLLTAILGLLLTGCAGISTAPPPEARQALAPTGKLRVGLLLGIPIQVIRDSASGESEKGVSDIFLSRTLKNAVVVRASNLAGTLEMLKSGRADATADNKATLFEISDQLPGYRVLDGRYNTS